MTQLKSFTLDEVHRLSRRFLDEQLLRPLEEFPAIWLASSACINGFADRDKQLSQMFHNRFSYRLTTEKPSIQQLVDWLAERCDEWGIAVENVEPTLNRLAVRSQQVVGMALQVLNKAHKTRHKLLTPALVEEHVFDLNE